MKKEEFIVQLAEYCEFGDADLTMNTPLKSIEGYDSMAVLSMIAFVDENFNVKLSSQLINDLFDFESLINNIGEEKFDE